MHEEHNVLRGNFDQTRSKMHDLLTTHFEDAIREKDRLTEELATTHTSLAVLNHEHAELQKRFGFTSDELTDERHNLKVARSEINQLEAYRAELTATVARQERYAQDEAQTVSQQMTVLTSKLTAERLEKEQFKILVDKVGAEIVKEKAEDDRLVSLLPPAQCLAYRKLPFSNMRSRFVSERTMPLRYTADGSNHPDEVKGKVGEGTFGSA